jgi:hypothetical protein
VTYELATGRVATLPQPRPITGSYRRGSDVRRDRRPVGAGDLLRVSLRLHRLRRPADLDAPSLTRTLCCTQPVINDRIVAWAENHFDSPGRQTGRLVVRSLRTGRTRTTPTSPAKLEPLLVGDRLYVLTAGPANRLLAVDL